MKKKLLSAGSSTTSKYHVPNLERALDVMELLSSRPHGLSRAEMAKSLKMSGNMVYRVSKTLEARGYLTVDQGGLYHMSPKILDMCRQSMDEYSLAAKAWPDMLALRNCYGETTTLNILGDNEGVLVERVTGKHQVCVQVETGLRFRLHASAPGKVLIAGMPGERRNDFIQRTTLERFTDSTITSRDRFKAEIMDVARLGYGIDRGEYFSGIRCVAVPILNQIGATVASLCLSAPSERLPDSSFEDIAEVMKVHALNISKTIGYQVPAAGGRRNA